MSVTRNRPGSHEQWLMALASKLTERGVEVCARQLGEREGEDLIRAFVWADLGDADHALPVFLRPFLKRPIASPAPVGAAPLFQQLPLMGVQERTIR